MELNKKITRTILMLFGVLVLSSFFGKRDKPTLFVIGDSTVKNGQGNGANGQWGWGSFIGEYFDSSKIEVSNKALGGTSTRTFYNNPKLWQQVLDSILPGDYVIMQFGHNDTSPVVDTTRARGTLKGNGDTYEFVNNPLLKQKEVVYTYGFYLRLFVKNIRDKGATAIICSPIPRNNWEGDTVRRTDYALWAEQAANQADVPFVPLQDLIINDYEKEGKEQVEKIYFGTKDNTHTVLEGAKLNAKILTDYIAQKNSGGLAAYLKK